MGNNLFNKGKSEGEARAAALDEASTEELSTRTSVADQQLQEASKQAIEDRIGLDKSLIQPTRMEFTNTDGKTITSVYHQMLTQDSKISNIKAEDKPVFRMWRSLINHALYLRAYDFALVLHAEYEHELAINSSVGGFERKALITTISNMIKGKGEGQNEGKKLL